MEKQFNSRSEEFKDIEQVILGLHEGINSDEDWVSMWNQSTKRLYAISEEGNLSKDEKEEVSRLFDLIKTKQKTTNIRKLQDKLGKGGQIGEMADLPAEFEDEFKSILEVIGNMPRAPFRQKKIRELVKEFGKKRVGSREVVVVPLKHKAKMELWNAYYSRLYVLAKQEIAELQDKQNPIEEEVARLTSLTEAITGYLKEQCIAYKVNTKALDQEHGFAA